MRKVYEAWIDEVERCVTLGDLENIQWQLSHGALKTTARLLHRFEADTVEEANAVLHIKMGWEPYVPMGEPASCPKGCGGVYYPQGSGDCPKCGRLF